MVTKTAPTRFRRGFDSFNSRSFRGPSQTDGIIGSTVRRRCHKPAQIDRLWQGEIATAFHSSIVQRQNARLLTGEFRFESWCWSHEPTGGLSTPDVTRNARPDRRLSVEPVGCEAAQM